MPRDQATTVRRVATGLVLAVPFLVAGVYFSLRCNVDEGQPKVTAVGGAGTADARHASVPIAATIPGRDVSAANLAQAEYTSRREQLERYQEMASGDVPNLYEAIVDDGDQRWTDFLIDLQYSPEYAERYRSCSKTFLKGERYQACSYSIRQVVAPGRGGRGEVVYATAFTSPDASRSCVEHARCMTKSLVGRNVSVPAGVTEPFAHRGEHTDIRDQDLEQDLAKLKELLEQYKQSLAMLEQLDPEAVGPDWAIQIATYKLQILSLQRLLEEGAA